jgi:hypothetical protein
MYTGQNYLADHWRRGCAQLSLGNVEQARSSFRLALRWDPSDSEVKTSKYYKDGMKKVADKLAEMESRVKAGDPRGGAPKRWTNADGSPAPSWLHDTLPPKRDVSTYPGKRNKNGTPDRRTKEWNDWCRYGGGRSHQSVPRRKSLKTIKRNTFSGGTRMGPKFRGNVPSGEGYGEEMDHYAMSDSEYNQEN